VRRKTLVKADIEKAMRHTLSNRAAARYLGCSYIHYKMYAKMFNDEETGLSFFDLHKNQQGKGIPKHLKGGKNDPAIMDILEGRIDPSHFTPEKIKRKLIHESILAEECNKCEFHERRVIDYRVPLLLNFKDNNKKNYQLDNLELLCYNCYFIYIGDVFSQEQVEQLQDFTDYKFKIERPTLDLDDEHLANMKALGIL
jgi:hypothetical protein